MSASVDTTTLSFPSYIRDGAAGVEAQLRDIFRKRGPESVLEPEVASLAAQLWDENGLDFSRLLDEMLADPRGRKKATIFSAAVRKASRQLEKDKKQRQNERQPFGDWRDSSEWLLQKNGDPVPCEQNAVLALRNQTDIMGRLRWNELARAVYVHQPLPWNASINRQVTDSDLTMLAAHLQLHTGLTRVTRDICWNAMGSASKDYSYHPVRDYLSSLTWDGVSRLKHLATDCLHAAAPDIAQILLRKWLLSAVARVYQPGCKADHMLILEGAQGLFKSMFFTIMGGEHCCDDVKDIGSKDAKQLIGRSWLVEVAELAAMDRRSAKEIKQEITITSDEFRSPYGRTPEKFPRMFVWGATSNPEAAGTFKDDTGNRRFWPIEIEGKLDTVWLKANRDQIWAEISSLYHDGEETWWLEDAQELAAVEAEQDSRRVRHECHTPIAAYLSGSPAQAVLNGLPMAALKKANDGDGQAVRVTGTYDVLINALGYTADRIRGNEKYWIAPILRDLGYKRKQVTHEGIRDWFYVKE